MITYLIDKGVNISTYSTIDYAAFTSNLEALKIYVEYGADLNGEVAPLRTACEYGTYEVVDYLLQNGADPNYKSTDKLDSCLYTAIDSGHLNIVKLLVENGADLDELWFNNEYNVLMNAAICSSKKVLQYFAEELNYDVNYKNVNNDTALIKTADGDWILNIEYLIKMGADVNAQNNKGETPLICASKMKEKYQNVKLLLEAGADVNIKDNTGKTALDYAVNSNVKKY